MSGGPVFVENLPAAYTSSLETRGWEDRPKIAVVIPIIAEVGMVPSAVLIVGLNPRGTCDALEKTFLHLISRHIAIGLLSVTVSNARSSMGVSTDAVRDRHTRQRRDDPPSSWRWIEPRLHSSATSPVRPSSFPYRPLLTFDGLQTSYEHRSRSFWDPSTTSSVLARTTYYVRIARGSTPSIDMRSDSSPWSTSCLTSRRSKEGG
jgi:hypothetical protein